MWGPKETDISDFIGVTSLGREKAVQWLQAHNNNLNTAVNAFFENPSALLTQDSQVSWDESHFHTDKTGDVERDQNQQSFTVNPPDTLQPNIFENSAPSRPPSRVSISGTNAADGTDTVPFFLGTEDDDVNRAVAMSMSESQTLAGQEMGVVENRNFGPATRTNYPIERWAMTTYSGQAQEILLNPEPSDRKRLKSAPAFLKPSPNATRLPALLTILHAIPMAREALLNRQHTLSDYGHDKDWWDGTPVARAGLRVVNVDSDRQQVDEHEIIYETQRLMAFLDKTNRAYGSTEVLASMEGLKDYHHQQVTYFYEKWQAAVNRAAPESPMSSIFYSRGTRTSPVNPTESQPISCLFPKVDEMLSAAESSLYGAVDNLLWSDTAEEDTVFFDKVGDVLTLEVTNDIKDSTGLGIDIPATWYLDRYMRFSAQKAREMRARKAEIMTHIRSEEDRLSTLAKATWDDGSESDSTSVLAAAARFYDEEGSLTKANEDGTGTGRTLANLGKSSTECFEIAEQVRLVMDRVSRKCKAFEERIESARKQIKAISDLYTKPSDDPQESPHAAYSLRGISTNAHTIYVLDNTTPADEDAMVSMEAEKWRWWKLDYNKNDAKPIVRIQVTEQDVLEAAKVESTNVFLVYASERAIKYQVEDLPSQLHDFVDADNTEFSKELEGISTSDSMSPSKRKAIDSDEDDLEVHHARSPPGDRTYPSDDMDPYQPGCDGPDVSPRSRIRLTPPERSAKDPYRTRYHDPKRSSPTLLHRRPVPLRTGNIGSYDDLVPLSLQNKESTTESDSMDAYFDGQNASGYEMQQKDRSKTLLPRAKDMPGYTLGSYTPEITMEDDVEI